MISSFCFAVFARALASAPAFAGASSVLAWADGFLRREGLNFLHFRGFGGAAETLRQAQGERIGVARWHRHLRHPELGSGSIRITGVGGALSFVT